MKAVFKWLLLALAVIQFAGTAFPPGNADLITIQSLALDFARGNLSLLYPGKHFVDNEAWVAHHEANIRQLGSSSAEPNWYTYPPLLPCLLAPIAAVGSETWRIVWGACQFPLILLFFFVTLRLLQSAGLKPDRIWLAVLFLGSYPLARAVQLGQIGILLALLLWSGLLLSRGKKPWGMIMAAVPFFVKPYVAVAMFPDLFNRKSLRVVLPVAASLLLLGVSISLAGWKAHVDYWDVLTTVSSAQTAFWGSQSLLSGALRLWSDLPSMAYGFQQNAALALTAKFILAAFLITAAVVQIRRRRKDDIACVGMWLSAVILGMPSSWEHYLIFLLPVVAYLWMNINQSSVRTALGIATVLLCVNWGPLYDESFTGRLAACLPMFGNLLLFIVLILFMLDRLSFPSPLKKL